ncbi:type III secretion system translocon protein, IpaD/SipD family [Cupriavidus sp. YR651]|uniref:IpaD/SipD/SspD family type III secretion system needle tip protein n=1 Tax=Cupriavidus sp. YR651 TaxID=1855315 RepID=UPI00088E52C5|nr:IpaD/SipD/SspD family type III secretion system needle tip protein [Cupriavidus sp. YR651]SDD38430.1 type III secretion system translocon protein, IpaD/SipD family [Cupriavidus sp. YR651]
MSQILGWQRDSTVPASRNSVEGLMHEPDAAPIGDAPREGNVNPSLVRLQASVQEMAAHARMLDKTSSDLNETLLQRQLSSMVDRLHLDDVPRRRETAARLREDGQVLAGRADDARSALAISSAFVEARVEEARRANADRAAEVSLRSSIGDIWNELASSIRKLQDGELALLEKAFEKNLDLYQDIVTLLGELNNYVNAVGDNKIALDCDKIHARLTAIVDKYSGEAGTIATRPTKEEALEICETLGLKPENCLVQRDGAWVVTVDLSNVRAMIANLPSRERTEISVARFNTWKAGFDAQVSRIEDGMQRIGQKHANAYSRFENYHKTIVSIIQSMADMLRVFCQNFA